MADISSLLGDPPPSLKIVDVGAMEIGSPPYAPLLELPTATVIGFEPNPEECAKLNAKQVASHRYVPSFVGDGSKRTFHWCNWAATSSLYPPNRRVLDRFTELPQFVQLEGTSEVETARLDDIPECEGADFIKIDVQGATLDVLRGGQATVSRALVVQCEVEFIPIYEGEPLFAEVDQEMRRLGFLFHQFTRLAARTFAPLNRRPGAPGQGAGQVIWTDAVYVRSFLDLQALQPMELVKLAFILDRLYQSHDLALLAFQHHDAKTGGDLWDRYANLLTGGVPVEKPPMP